MAVDPVRIQIIILIHMDLCVHSLKLRNVGHRQQRHKERLSLTSEGITLR